MQGPVGPKGEEGAKGEQGDQGDNGEQVPGPDGMDGPPGEKGYKGTQGDVGVIGQPGNFVYHTRQSTGPNRSNLTELKADSIWACTASLSKTLNPQHQCPGLCASFLKLNVQHFEQFCSQFL